MIGLIKVGLSFALLNIFIIILILALIQLIYLKLKAKQQKKGVKVVTFIHPNCTDCGGGEKVLWYMLNSLLNKNKEEPNPFYKSIIIKIITAGNVDSTTIRKKLKNIFNIDFSFQKSNDLISSIELVRVKSDFLLKPQPIGTMFLQILGQILFSFEIIIKNYSDAYIDTTGLPFTYFILKYLGHAKVSAYVHYPFISDDMINDIKYSRKGVHSRGIISKIPFLKPIKILYYRMIYLLYKLNGNQISYAQCNSSWTLQHMQKIWKKTQLTLLYPPCNNLAFQEIAQNTDRANIVVSFAQFRPEKNHHLQIRIMSELLSRRNVPSDIELHMIGGVRNEKDEAYFNELQLKINELGLQNHIKLLKNVPFSMVQSEFSRAKIGIHTMKDEHFGISIIEMMAAGLIVIAHRSAGAKLDIIDPSEKVVGFTVESDKDYSLQIENILNDYENLQSVAVNAVERADYFGEESFQRKFNFAFKQMI